MQAECVEDSDGPVLLIAWRALRSESPARRHEARWQVSSRRVLTNGAGTSEVAARMVANVNGRVKMVLENADRSGDARWQGAAMNQARIRGLGTTVWAASVSSVRACGLPLLVMGPRLTRSPLERSESTRPR